MTDRFYKDIEVPNLAAGDAVPTAPDAGFIQIYGRDGKLVVKAPGVSAEQTLTPVSGVYATPVTVQDTTDSTDTATGALVVAGGIGVGGSISIGGNINIPGVTPTTGQVITKTETGLTWSTPSAGGGGGGSGDVVGPASATDGAVALFDGATGKLLKVGGTLGTAAFTPSTNYQAALVSGANIKTINGQAVLGSGDLVVSATGAVTSVAGRDGDVVLTPADVGAEPADATILKAAAIGVTVQGYDAATAKRNTANTFTEVQSFGKGVQETYSAVAASNIDVTAGGVFAKTISGATTFTVSNVPAAGAVASFILELTNPGTNVTFWAGVKWPGGTAPTLTAAGVDVLGFYTRDGGTTWRGMVLAKDSK